MQPMGLSFQPGAEDDERKRKQAMIPQAIKVLSLRLPRILGAQAPAPEALLRSPGSAGLPSPAPMPIGGQKPMPSLPIGGQKPMPPMPLPGPSPVPMPIGGEKPQPGYPSLRFTSGPPGPDIPGGMASMPPPSSELFGMPRRKGPRSV